MTVHAIIPDCQVKDGVDLSYLTWVGKYLVEKKPDVIVQIGDFADMPSLSSYDVGKKLLTYVIRRQTRHISKVPNLHNHIRLLLN